MNSTASRRSFLGRLGLGAAALACGEGVWAEEGAARRPNVLVVMTDDQGWGDIASHGNAKLDTPVMDRLAAEGARFDRFYVCPVCAPTRAALLTGRYHVRTGVSGVSRGEETMRSEETTVAEILSAAGYATGCFGKWHNGAHYPYHPNGQGFDEFSGFCMGHWNNYFDTGLERNGTPLSSKGYINDVVTDAALAFIEEHRDEPFFCYVPYNTPHSPFQVPDRYFDKYKARGLDDTLACVYGMCENLDDNLGRLLAQLDALGLAEDTIVVFLCDNGPNTDRFNGGMRGRKGSVHEGGVRSPFFIRWPKHIEPGTVVAPIAAHIDLLLTLLDLTGVQRPPEVRLDGKSVAPLLAGKTDGWPDRMLFTYWRGRGAVRTQRYRMVMENKSWLQLYDMVADPGQKQDIAKAKPEVTEQLKAAYDTWFSDVSQGMAEPPPIPLGHREMPQVEMTTPDATWQGDLKFGGRHANNNWVTNWTSTEDHLYWEVDVVRAGSYDVTLMYTCPEADVGARICVEADGQRVEGVVKKAHDPPFVPSPDRVPRREVYEKVWAPLPLGKLELPKGRCRIYVKTLEITGQAAMDLKSAVFVASY